MLLLPGVVFFVGLQMPEQFSRESVERTALGQISGVLAVSLSVHILLLAANALLQNLGAPPISFHALIETIVLEQNGARSLSRAANMLHANVVWISAYLLASVLVGVGSGFLFGKCVVPKRGGFAPHRWVYDLKTNDNFTVAYVLTHVKEGKNVLLYHGFLRHFALKRDGTFAYLVLAEASRGYMVLNDEYPVTQPHDQWQEIGRAPASISKLPKYTKQGAPQLKYFVIEGEDVANVVFECRGLRKQNESVDSFDDVVERATKQLEPALIELLRSTIFLTVSPDDGSASDEPYDMSEPRRDTIISEQSSAQDPE